MFSYSNLIFTWEPTQKGHTVPHIHTQSFWERYVFSTDHKVIAKQFLITAIIWAIIGGAFSVIFRLQLGFPEAKLEWLRPLFGDWITASGKIDNEFYLALITMHGTIMVFFVLTAGLSGHLQQFFSSLCNWAPATWPLAS